MTTRTIPPSVATAALLKSQLDQGKDYFDLLAPFVQRIALEEGLELIDPNMVRARMSARFGLEIPLRTQATILDRLAKRSESGIRKEGGAYLRTGAAGVAGGDAEPLVAAFSTLGASFAAYCAGRLSAVSDTDSALQLLCGFLETHSATLVLDEPPPEVKTGRREDIIVASYLADLLQQDVPAREALLALLQGLVLARAVALPDLAELDRRLSKLVVYFDTPFVLALAGLYGTTDREAIRDAVRLLKELGATPAVFDATVSEVRRILLVYENRLDTAAGRQSLYPTALTSYLLAINATGTDVRARSALLEATLAREGITLHQTPPREREFVSDELALAQALEDVRGEGYEAREQHDLNCIAAILTLRRGKRAETLEDARAILAATGMIVRTTRKWWSTHGKGIPPVLESSAIINYCWLKRPKVASRIHQVEMAALCAAVLQPSEEAWNGFKKELRTMVNDGQLSGDEAAVILIDSYASKLLVESEESESLGPHTVAQIVEHVRAEQRRETDNMRQMVDQERSARTADQLEASRILAAELAKRDRGFEEKLGEVVEQLTYERTRAHRLEGSVNGLARILSWAIAAPLIGALFAIVAAVAVFPLIGASVLSQSTQAVLNGLTILVAFFGGAWGVSALSAGKWLQERLERAIRLRLIGHEADGQLQLPKGEAIGIQQLASTEQPQRES